MAKTTQNETVAERRSITTPKAVYNIRSMEPPKRVATAKGSPYIDPEKIPAFAQACAEGWSSPIEPVDTEVKGRLAMRHFKTAVAEYHNIPREAIVARLWPLDPDTDPKPVEWVFALAVKKGAISETASTN